MRTRPPYLTVICWVALFGVVLGIYANTVLTLDPDPVLLGGMRVLPDVPWSVVLAMIWIQWAGSGIAAWHMLKHANWARWLYVALIALDLVWRFTSVIDPAYFLFAIVYLVIITVVLFLPASNEYFSSRRSRRA